MQWMQRWLIAGVLTFGAAGIVLPAHALTLNEAQELLASDGEAGDFFGQSVAIHGDIAVIGAPFDDNDAVDSGSAYVFHRDSSGIWREQAKLVASDPAAGAFFGASVAVHGDTAVIGASADDDNGIGSGSAYVFVRDSSGVWREQAKLLPSDGEANERFGDAVAIDGDTVVVGARFDDANFVEASGSAYVFVRDGAANWQQAAKLTASDPSVAAIFGVSVAIDGDTVVIGASQDNNVFARAGSAYVFVRDSSGSWTEQAKLLASDPAESAFFGASVAVHGKTAVIGAFGDNDNGVESGSAYVFVRDSSGIWREQAKLLASDGARGDRFGWSVSVFGDTAVIGALQDDNKAEDTGSAYVFRRNSRDTWSQQAKLLANDGATGDLAGASVSVSADTALVGAPGHSDNGEDSGAAYVFPLSSKPIEFALHDVSAKINPRQFLTSGALVLGAASDGIDPPAETVRFSLDGWSFDIPPGSFAETNAGDYRFKGRVDGVKLQVTLEPQGNGVYRFRILGNCVRQIPVIRNPVKIKLSIGDDAGTTSVKAKITRMPNRQ